MGLLDRLTAPFRGMQERTSERAAAENAQLQARREAYMKELMEEWAEADKVELKPYRDLSIGEAKMGKTPAVEYGHSSMIVRVYNLMTQDQMSQASVTEALGMRLDDLEEGEIGDVIDVKPKDMPAIEHGTVNLGPVPEFKNADGQRWRFFLRMSYSAAAGSGRGGIQSRYFIADATL